MLSACSPVIFYGFPILPVTGEFLVLSSMQLWQKVHINFSNKNYSTEKYYMDISFPCSCTLSYICNIGIIDYLKNSLFFTFYQCMEKKVLFLSSILEIEFLQVLHVFRFLESKNKGVQQLVYVTVCMSVYQFN